MGTHTQLKAFHFHRIDDNHVRIYQDGYKEKVFSRAELAKALESEQDFVRAYALSEAQVFLDLPCTCSVNPKCCLVHGG